MKVKLEMFCSLLKEAEEEKGLDDSSVSAYLLDNLLNPYLEGENVLLGSLDYDAFSLTDLDILFHYVGDLDGVCRQTNNKSDKLLKSTPAALPARAFC